MTEQRKRLPPHPDMPSIYGPENEPAEAPPIRKCAACGGVWGVKDGLVACTCIAPVEEPARCPTLNPEQQRNFVKHLVAASVLEPTPVLDGSHGVPDAAERTAKEAAMVELVCLQPLEGTHIRCGLAKGHTDAAGHPVPHRSGGVRWD